MLGECSFLAANLYARSIFGEDALANVSIEKPFGSSPETPIQGHVRIRAKTQVRMCIKTRVRMYMYSTCISVYEVVHVMLYVIFA